MASLTRYGALAVALASTASCRERPVEHRPWSASELDLLASLAALAPPPNSPGNEVADDPRAAALGRGLFFDRRLSAAGDRSCASCHQPERFFTDGLPRARGSVELARNTPTLIGAAWSPFLGWDGRKDSVWAQSIAPLLDAREHGLSARALSSRIAAHHRSAYEQVFGAPPEGDGGELRVVANVGKALEAYVRTLAPQPAPFDRYVAALRAGDPRGGGHLSASAIRGLRAFLGPGRCVSCHHGPLFTDHEFHALGLPTDAAREEDREGRAHGARAVRSDPFRCGGPFSATDRCDEVRFVDADADTLRAAFRTPSLRNVAETAPYMHEGQLPTLEDVVGYYRSIPSIPAVAARDPLLGSIDRSISVPDLVAFLRSLSGAPPPAAHAP